MRHGRKIHKLSKAADQRKALLRSLASQLFLHGEITTTMARAKALKPFAESIITFAKKGDLHSRRLAAAVVRPMLVNEDQTALQKLFAELGPRYATRNGGYVRVLKLGNRRGDNAPIVVCQLVK